MATEPRRAEPASRTVKVCIGEFRLAAAGEQLVIHGLGSCVAVVLYDQNLKIGGLAHIMLPTVKENESSSQLNKFADVAIGKHSWPYELRVGTIKLQVKAGEHKDCRSVSSRGISGEDTCQQIRRNYCCCDEKEVSESAENGRVWIDQ